MIICGVLGKIERCKASGLYPDVLDSDERSKLIWGLSTMDIKIVKKKNPYLAALWAILPGGGCFYNGKVGKGAGYLLTGGGFGFLYVWSIYDSYMTAIYINEKATLDLIEQKKIEYKKKEEQTKKLEVSDEEKKSKMREYFTKGQQAFSNGNYEKAIEFYEKVLKIDTRHQPSIENIKRAKEKLNESKK